MKFTIKTVVQQPFHTADKGFGKDWLVKLNPPVPPFRITRFDGLNDGDRVHIRFNFFLFKDDWEYVVRDKVDNEREWSFVDEGVRMPFFLKRWRHRYRLSADNKGMNVTDEVDFDAPVRVLDFLLYPYLYLHFLYRKPIYKRRYGKI